MHGDSTTSKYFTIDLGVIEKDIANLKNQKDSIIEKITNVKVSIPTLEKYLELYVAVAFKAKITTDISIKDQIVKKFFLNFFWNRRKSMNGEMANLL